MPILCRELKDLSAQNQEKEEKIGLKDRQLVQLQELCRRLQKNRNEESSSASESLPKTTNSVEKLEPKDQNYEKETLHQ